MDVADISGVPDWLPEHLQAGGIEELYPPQADAVEAGVTAGANLVASVPTASGKTLIAELAMLSAVREGGTALYIVPLRALASEKQAEFEEFEQYGVEVGVSTGNYESSGEWLAENDIIVATSEKVDSLVRNDAPWMDDLSCVVADEVHLVDDAERGPTLEVTLAKLRQLNPDLQTVALSATIGNADELADWLDAALVDSDWRPIELKKGVHYGQALHLEDGSQQRLPVKSGEKQTAAIVRDTLTADRDEDGIVVEEGGSSLVFVNSRRNAEAAARRLASTTSDFLDGEERRQLAQIATEIRDVSDTETSDDLADAVEQGAAFHHAGLCVAGDTEIIQSDGTFRQIRNVVDDPDGGALGLTPEYRLDTVDITDTFRMEKKKLLKITTKTGNEIRVSANHPLPVMGEAGIDWVKAESLETGQHVARPRRIEVSPNVPKLRSLIPGEYRVYRQYDVIEKMANQLEQTTLDGWYRPSYAKNRNIRVEDFRTLCNEVGEEPDRYLGRVMCQSGQKPIRIPEEIDRELCWLVGAVAGDGYLTEHAISLTGNSEIIDEFNRIVDRHFGRTVREGESPSGTSFSEFYSKIVSDILSNHFGMPQKEGGTLQLPTVPLSDDLLAGYLSGLFDADGSVSVRDNEDGSPCIEFYSTSDRLITQLKTALLRFGILAYRDTRDVEGRVTEHDGRQIRSLSNVHRLTIYGLSQLRIFADEIGFRHREKSSKLREAVDRNGPGGRGQQDVIPSALGNRVLDLRRQQNVSMADLEPAIPKATLSRYENQQTPMKRSTFQSLAELLDDDLLATVASSDIYWDRIESIEMCEPERLYDLSTSSQNFVANGIIAHNTSDHRELVEEAFRDRLLKVVSATPTLAAGVNTPSRRVVVRDWRRYDGTAGGMAPLSVLEVHQMMGRAGRPGLDPYGEAVLIASSHDELDELFERYVWAEPEPVRSKLAAEPALRTHLLATVASGFASTRSGILEFLERTLHATQNAERDQLEAVTDRMLTYLERNDFLERDGDTLRATGLGHTVSRLYLDPMSAAEVIDGLRDADDAPSALALYHLVSRTPDLYELYLRSGDEEEYTMLAYEREEEFLGRQPTEFEAEFEDWLSALKTARLLEDWASEVDEGEITDRYGVGPGDIRGKVEAAQWLLGAAESLAGELGLACAPAIREARTRVEHGVKAELVDLAGVRGVGRKRARRLYDAEIRTRADLREADKSVVLGALRGREATAENVLENAGRQDPSMDDVEPADLAGVDLSGGGTTGADGSGEDAEDQSSLGDF